MNCRQFEARIHDVLDERRELRGDHGLTVHRQQCSHCQRVFLEWERLASFFPNAEMGLEEDLSEADSSPMPRFRPKSDRRRVMVGLGIAAALVATLIPLLTRDRSVERTSLADSGPVAAAPANTNFAWNPDLSWPQVLATIEEFPRHFDSLGPVYLCTAQMTGVSTLTSPLNLTMDLLRIQLTREAHGKIDNSDSSGRFQRAMAREQIA